MEPVLINKTERVFLPESYDDRGFTCRMYENIFGKWDVEKPVEERDYVHLFSLLTGATFVTDSVEAEEKLWQLVRWYVDTQPNYAMEPPKTFTLGGKEIEVPKNVGAMSIGQNIVLKQVMDKGKYVNQFIGMAVAIYLQPLVDGDKFKKARAIELYNTQIAEMPASEVFPLGFFLLKRANRNGSTLQNGFQKVLDSLTAIPKRMLRFWLASIGLENMPTSRW